LLTAVEEAFSVEFDDTFVLNQSVVLEGSPEVPFNVPLTVVSASVVLLLPAVAAVMVVDAAVVAVVTVPVVVTGTVSDVNTSWAPEVELTTYVSEMVETGRYTTAAPPAIHHEGEVVGVMVVVEITVAVLVAVDVVDDDAVVAVVEFDGVTDVEFGT
jgi:hypothetical protein